MMHTTRGRFHKIQITQITLTKILCNIDCDCVNFRSMGNIRVADSESSSVDSMELEHDSDTGMESMSSAETPGNKRLSCSFCTFDPQGGVTLDPNSEGIPLHLWG